MRALKVLDRTQPYETHKFGVVYVLPGQVRSGAGWASEHGVPRCVPQPWAHTRAAGGLQTSEGDILGNPPAGSAQYMHFLSSLGSLVVLRGNTTEYVGGLDTAGDAYVILSPPLLATPAAAL